MTPRPVTRPELKTTIRTLLEEDPQAFFAVLREVRDEMQADGTLEREPTEGDKLRAEVETDLAILADFFRGFA